MYRDDQLNTRTRLYGSWVVNKAPLTCDFQYSLYYVAICILPFLIDVYYTMDYSRANTIVFCTICCTCSLAYMTLVTYNSTKYRLYSRLS